MEGKLDIVSISVDALPQGDARSAIVGKLHCHCGPNFQVFVYLDSVDCVLQAEKA